VERHADDGTGRWRAFYHHEGDRRGRQREPGQPALALTVDTAAPAAPAAPTSTAPSTNDNTPGIHIGVGLTDTPSLYVDGVKVPATYDPVTGMLTPTTPLADGAHSITTTLTDAAGNESPQSAALPLTVDTAAPAAPTGVTVTDDVAPVTGAIAANGASNDNKPTFAGAAGSAEAGSTITVMDGATVLGTAVVAADGSWSVTPTTALADGAHSITTRATDAAGNVSPVSPALALTVDTAAPAAPAAPTSTAPSTNDNTPGIHIGVGLTDTPSLYVDGVKVPATYDPVTGMLTPTTPLGDGVHQFTTTLTDAAGNESPQSAALPLTVDTAAPAAPTGVTVTDDVAPVTGAIAANGASNDNKPTFAGAAGSAEAGSTITVMDGATVLGTAVVAADGSWSVTPTTALADGAHSITTRATDAAGNVSPVSPALALTVDTAAPAAPTGVTVTDDVAPVTGAIAANGASNDNKPTFAGAAGSAEAGSTITVMDGATVLGTAVVAADGSWSVTPTTPLGDGAHSITTRATDAAGNVSPVSPALALTVDTVAPTTTASVTAIRDDVGAITGTVASSGVTDDTSLVVSGTLSTGLITGERVRIYDGSSYLGDATVSGTSWTYADSRTLTDGQSVSYTARVSDPAGNQSAAGTAYTATVDTVAPTTTASVTAIRDDVGAITGTVASGGVTDDTSLVVSGTLSTGLITGERVRIYDGSSYLGDATVSGTSWTYADSRTLTDGQSVSYTARVSDPAGVSAAGTAYTATVDTLDTFTWGGETHALNLAARVNAQDGKTYYALDANGNGAHDVSDKVSHDWLDGLLNGGADTVDTQPGGAVKGSMMPGPLLSTAIPGCYRRLLN
jgi:erythromycin esterase-like protein